MWKFLIHFKSKNFRRLFLAQMISQFGDRIHQMALIGLVAERAFGSATDLAKILSFTIIPVFIVGPIAGVYVDRWDRRTTLFVCDFLRGLLVLLIPFVFIHKESMVPIYIIVFLVFCLSRFYVPAKMSIIPDLVEDEHLIMANSLMTTTGMLALVLGAILGGVLVDQLGARLGFIWDAVTFFISGLLIFTIVNLPDIELNRKKVEELARTIKRTVWGDMKDGLIYLKNHKEIRFIINMLFVLFAAAGAIYVVIIIFIQQSFHSVTLDLGILVVALGIGLFLGTILYGKFGQRSAWYTTTFFCLILGGAMINIFAILVARFPNLLMAGILAAVLGVVIGPIFIAANTATHMVSDDAMRGKVFTALEIVIHFAFLLTMFISSVISEHIKPMWILVCVGTIVSLVGVLGIANYRKVANTASDMA